MQYSVTTTEKNGILQACERFTNLGDAKITGNTGLLADFTNYSNLAYNEITALILQNEGSWEFDDDNYTNFPIATKNLVASQVDYALPGATVSADASTLLRIVKVQVLDLSSLYQNLIRIDESAVDSPLTTLFNTAGFPRYYRVINSSIEIYPFTSSSFCTLTNGLKIFFERAQSDFATTDTTKQPGFPSIYHPLIPIIASEYYAAINKLDSLGFIQQKKEKMFHDLGWNVANRNKDVRQRIVPASVRRNNFYE